MTTGAIGQSSGTAPPLSVMSLDVFYGEAQVLHRVALDVSGGEIVAVVGPNGSGKSTLLRTIQGLQRSRAGSIRLGEERIDGLDAHEVVARGLTSILDGRRLLTGRT